MDLLADLRVCDRDVVALVGRVRVGEGHARVVVARAVRPVVGRVGRRGHGAAGAGGATRRRRRRRREAAQAARRRVGRCGRDRRPGRRGRRFGGSRRWPRRWRRRRRRRRDGNGRRGRRRRLAGHARARHGHLRLSGRPWWSTRAGTSSSTARPAARCTARPQGPMNDMFALKLNAAGAVAVGRADRRRRRGVRRRPGARRRRKRLHRRLDLHVDRQSPGRGRLRRRAGQVRQHRRPAVDPPVRERGLRLRERRRDRCGRKRVRRRHRRRCAARQHLRRPQRRVPGQVRQRRNATVGAPVRHRGLRVRHRRRDRRGGQPLRRRLRD